MASGGGVSGLFPRPDWQRRAGVPDPRGLGSPVWISRQVARPSRFRGRGVPDVAANADGHSGYRILVGGVDTVGGGTSASTPLWAALVALLAEELRRPLGWLNPLAYRADLQPGFRDVTRGTNDVSPRPLGFFSAGPGWDAVSGLGSPDGEGLLRALGPRS
jgi:kumamolisin